MAIHITTPPTSAWVQPSSPALTVPNQGPAQMRRSYKIPTSALKSVLQNIKVNATLGLVESYIATSAGNLIDAGVDSIFTPPADVDNWLVQSYQIDQREAGEYMELKVVYSWTDIPFDSLSSDWEETTLVNEGCDWQTYSVSPYIYCNEVDHDDTPITATGSVPSPTGGNALRRHIEMTFQMNPQDSLNSPNVWGNAGVPTWVITESERRIREKVAAGVNPIFHKPVVHRTFNYKTNKSTNVPQGGDGIDRIGQPGIAAPGWTGSYIFQGRSFSKNVQTFFTASHPEGIAIYNMTYTDTWEGALEPDQNFYGPNAWKFHEGPDAQ